MIREGIVWTYLLLFRICYGVFRWLPLRSVTLFWVTYGDNVKPVNDQLARSLPTEKRYLVYDHAFMKHPETWKPHRMLRFRRLRFIRLAYLLATSRTVFVDNYVAEFSVAKTRQGTRRIQLWHAAGTLKQFGLTSTKSLFVSERTRDRFRRVYREYGDFIVPGMRCATQFMAPHDLKRSHFKPLGIPRTDYWFDAEQRTRRTNALKDRYVQADRRVLLYAPTYREYKGAESQAIQQFEHLAKKGWTVLIKLHPTMRTLSTYRSEHVYLVDDTYSINDYLLITDVVVTDYSSIPFESCLLEIPVFLYTPDIDTYRQLPGLVDQYPKPLPVRQSAQMEQLIEWIMSDEALDESRQKMNEFQADWYDQTPGRAVDRIIRYYYDIDR